MNDRDERLKEVARIAAALEKQTGCPAQLLIAQWAIESQWGEKPVGHANYFGIKRAARHTKFCIVTTHEVFTPAQLAGWNRQHPHQPARVIETMGDNRVRVAVDDEFADYESLDGACEDYAWLITNGERYRTAWQRYLADKDVAVLVADVAHTYATAPQYAQLVTQVAGQHNVLRALADADVERTIV
jgi:flagellum-specific peptidoglycan hydrolase FlgJ